MARQPASDRKPNRGKLRSWWDYTVYVYGSEWKYLVGLFGIISGFVVSFLQPIPAFILTTAGTVITLALLALDTDDLRHRWREDNLKRNPDEANTYPFEIAQDGSKSSGNVLAGGEIVRFAFLSGQPLRDDGYENRERIWFDSSVNDLLRQLRAKASGGTGPTVVANAASYRLPADLAEISASARWKSKKDPTKKGERQAMPQWFNGRLARLEVEPTVEALASGKTFRFQLVRYFDGEASNEIWHWTEGEELKNGGRRLPLAYVTDIHHHIFKLERAQVANIVGVSLLAITSDDQVLFVEQSSKSSVAPGAFASSSSGSLDWADVIGITGRVPVMQRLRSRARRKDPWTTAPQPSLLEVLKRGMLRELREEALVRPEEVLDDTFRLTGYFRWLSRAAKPEFCGLVRLSVSVAELQGREHSEEEKNFTSSLTSVPLSVLVEAADTMRAKKRITEPGLKDAYDQLRGALAESNADVAESDVRFSTSSFATWVFAVDAISKDAGHLGLGGANRA